MSRKITIKSKKQILEEDLALEVVKEISSSNHQLKNQKIETIYQPNFKPEKPK